MPDHIGIQGNKLPRAGWSASLLGLEPLCGVRCTLCLFRSWERQVKELTAPFAKRKTSLLFRRDLRLVVGYLSGHYTVNYHLVNMHLVSAAECRPCKEDNEFTHNILLECAALVWLKGNISLWGNISLQFLRRWTTARLRSHLFLSFTNNIRKCRLKCVIKEVT